MNTQQIGCELQKRSRMVISSCSTINTLRVTHVKNRDLSYMYTQKIRKKTLVIEKNGNKPFLN